MEQKGVSPVVGTILLIAITVALAAVVATLVSGLGGRGTPPSAMLTVTAEYTGPENQYKLRITHEGGDDLVRSDLQVMASSSPTAMNTYTFPPGTGTFSVGGSETLTDCAYSDNSKNKVVTVFIIHVPSKQKIFSSSSVVVR